MARIGINTGATANDGGGSSLRAGAGIINDNFLEVYNYLGAGSTTQLATPLFASVTAGINTLSKVGLGTTAPTSQLTVSGDIIATGITTTATAVVGSAVTINATGANVTGVVTATSFEGDGSSLTGVGNTDNILSNAVNVSGVTTTATVIVGSAVTANATGVNVTGVTTSSGGFIGALTGTASTASFATTSFGLAGSPNITVGSLVGTSATVGTAVTANATGVNVTGVTTSSGGFIGALTGNVTGNADTATSAAGLTGSPNITVGSLVGTSATVGTAVTANGTGVNVTGVVTATSFEGDGTNLTGITAGITTSHTNVQVAWSVTANASSAFRFTGPGNDGTEDNPDLYLVRGQRYRFTNNAGASHPFNIRSSPGGSAFNDEVTNNGAGSGNIDFNVQHDAPNRLYYQCSNHAGMLGNIYILRQNAFGNGGFNELDAALFN